MLAQTSVFLIIFFSLPSAFWAEGFLPQRSAIFGRGTFGRGVLYSGGGVATVAPTRFERTTDGDRHTYSHLC